MTCWSLFYWLFVIMSTNKCQLIISWYCSKVSPMLEEKISKLLTKITTNVNEITQRITINIAKKY